MGGRPVIAAATELRPGRYEELDILDMYSDVVHRMLDEWDLDPGEIDGVLAAPADGGSGTDYGSRSHIFMHERIYEEFGIRPRFSETMYAGGATYGLMVQRAACAIEAGLADAVLCVGAGKFPRVSAGGGAAMARLVSHPEFEEIYGAYVPVHYALAANRHIATHGTTRDQLSAVACAAREWALLNPNARMFGGGELTPRQIATSREIASPFRLFDCSVPCEGGGAILVTSAATGRRMGASSCSVLGFGEFHAHGYLSWAVSLDESGAVESGARAFEMAGLVPSDIDFVEIYDAFSINPIMSLEDLGFCARGTAGRFVAEGNTGPGGSLPMNTYGGLLSYGHTGRSSGMSMIVEAVHQLLGRAPQRQVGGETCLIHTYGGMMSEHSTLILGPAS